MGPKGPCRTETDRWPSDIVLTITELSAYLKISKSTLYKLAQEGKVPGQKVGRHWRFHKEVVDEWLGKANPAAPRRAVGTRK
ncbi:MAG: helix-turn-helix domain-containing protein [Planctomycetota bacterium]